MDMDGTVTIAAPRAVVWERLNEAATLGACIPGCQELTGTPEDGFEATVVQKVGPVKATFTGTVTLHDVVEGVSYRLVGAGKGGVAGFARGAAEVTLADVEGGTELAYTVEARVGGKLAQLGNRIVGGFARKMGADFFESFKAAVEA